MDPGIGGDDQWRCVGGPEDLLAALLAAPGLEVREVSFTQVATPPGYVAR